MPAAESPADEARLAQQAAAGNGDAFADLYERYERRAYNLCYRILGSEDDAADATQEAFVGLLRRLPSLEGRDLAFGSYLFTSARNACYDLIERRRRTEPSDDIPESSIPVGGGVGGGGLGFDPGDPEDDPERNVLLDARQEEIRAANAGLPERQREALALKELEELSYDEIAAIMGMNRNSVAQLISRARINLRDALRGSALASIAAATPECERALALMAARQDDQPIEAPPGSICTPGTARPAASAGRPWTRPASPIAPGSRSPRRPCCSARRWPRRPRPWAPTGATWRPGAKPHAAGRARIGSGVGPAGA